MAFRVTARTLLQLGAELISSDAIAFYELIKNAFDAGSERVQLHVVIRIPYDDYQALSHKLSLAAEITMTDKNVFDHTKEKLLSNIDSWFPRDSALLKCRVLEVDSLEALCETLLDQIRNEMLLSVDSAAPGASRLKGLVSETDSLKALREAQLGANYISVIDKGEGMSLQDLDDIFLTIGTRSRLKQRERQQSSEQGKEGNISRPILGEKGIGRLSAMRLGQKLRVKTSRKGERCWNLLEIDWSMFSHDSDALIDEVEVSPRLGEGKDNPDESGTAIRISGLESSWTKSRLEDIAKTEFSKLIDPFAPQTRNPITVKYNGEALYIPPLDRLLFEHAHAFMQADFTIGTDGQPSLVGRIDYRRKHREKAIELQGAHLFSTSHSSNATLQRLGPFSVCFYWYNRQLLKAIDGIGELKQVRDLQAAWAGGLMLYRDGFRVNPYGSPEDDWLDLDKKAFASGGYKVNRRQIIGKVDISSAGNPSLLDQTNREGIRDCDEKRAMVRLLQHILSEEFKTFLEAVDKETQPTLPQSFADLEERVEVQEKKLTDNLQELIRRHPQIERETAIVGSIRETMDEVRTLMDEASRLAKSFEKGGSQMSHLAGLGLMVEVVAHG